MPVAQDDTGLAVVMGHEFVAEVVEAGPAQPPRRGQAGDAAADDHHVTPFDGFRSLVHGVSELRGHDRTPQRADMVGCISWMTQK